LGLGGVAELPLHGGRVPAWLARYMKRLAGAIVEAIVELYSPRRFVELVADPVWFQAFNNVIGMDWDSSGSTTVTLGVVRQVVWERPELGLVVAGGKGRLAREALGELERAVEEGRVPESVGGEAARASRLVAKADSVLLQDGYELYHHAVVVSVDGWWAVVQQGMNVERRLARRYHWVKPLPEREATLETRRGVAAAERSEWVSLDLTSRASLEARRAIPEIVASMSPRALVGELRRVLAAARGLVPLSAWLGGGGERLRVLRYYRPPPRPPRGFEERLRAIREASPRSIEELVMLPGVGPSTLRSLALVAEVVYGVPVSHVDPAGQPLDPFRYAYAVGGKDGVPFPFSVEHARRVLEFLESVVAEARLDEKGRRRALERIERLASLLPR